MQILKKKEIILKEITRLIKQGGIIVFPTDTVYGLLADATSEIAVKKLLKIKKRKTQKPIPIFVKNIEMAKKLALINKQQEKFLKKVWPGKVTIVLKRKGKLPKFLFRNKKTIGLRIPDYKIINQLLLIINRPLTGTSANISGHPSSTKIKEIISQFKNKRFQPDLIISAGNLPKSKPSTVLDLTTWPPKILRP
jgi:L-threonylcarbamoyladenylate synthase